METQHFQDLKKSVEEARLIMQGTMKPTRVWHIDEKTGERTLLEDNTPGYQMPDRNARTEEILLKENAAV